MWVNFHPRSSINVRLLLYYYFFDNISKLKCITALHTYIRYCLLSYYYGAINTKQSHRRFRPRVTQSPRSPELISELGGAWA